MKSYLSIDTLGLYYREVNDNLKRAISDGYCKLKLKNVAGQRFICANLNYCTEIDIFGKTGDDLGAFIDGPYLNVHGNARNGCGNNMNNGTIIVHGQVGDSIGLSAHGGQILVKGNAGYRAGFCMREFVPQKPVILIGGTAQDFPGQYMAGGTLIILGLNLDKDESHPTHFIGSGMRGGTIYFRGNLGRDQIDKQVNLTGLDKEDETLISKYIREFSLCFGYRSEQILDCNFIKVIPSSM
jgi:glutamate synthase domain-containing protein 3